MRERLKKEPNQVMRDYLFGPRLIADRDRSFGNMMKANIAHALMLDRKRIISHEDAATLVKACLDLVEKGSVSLTLRPELEDFYFNVEQYILDTVGSTVGGRLHTGRSRNDLSATLVRMDVRDALFKLYALFLDVRWKIIGLAEQNTSSVMTGYTHMQPAQPTTLAHYLIGVSEALERDYERLEAAYSRLNLSPMGAAAFAGTSFPIDREYVSELLGFDGLVENTLDAVASRDYLLEIVYVFASMGSTISRLAHDLYVWCTDEFGYIELDDSMSASSSIMPQKKNPVPLEHIKSKASHFAGAFVSIFAAQKTMPFGHSRDTAESAHLFWDAVTEVEAMLVLLGETVATLTVDTERMESRANANFSTATDLADELVKREGLPFRTAHQIVGSLVGECHEKGLSMSAIDGAHLDEKAREYLGRPLGWNDEEVKATLEARSAVERRNCTGGPADRESVRMIEQLRATIAGHRRILDSRTAKLKGAGGRMESDTDSLLR